MTYLNALKTAGLEGATGLSAIKSVDRPCIDCSGIVLTGSVDLDAAFSTAEAQLNRWDYGLGFKQDSKEVAIWVEPHSATSTREISTMLKKLQWLKDKLNTQGFSELRKQTCAATAKGLRAYWWTTQGKIGFHSGSQDARRLAQNGLNFPTRKVKVGRE